MWKFELWYAMNRQNEKLFLHIGYDDNGKCVIGPELFTKPTLFCSKKEVEDWLDILGNKDDFIVARLIECGAEK